MHVAELGSFSKAAEQLGYSQPTVSVHIKQLESAVNARLFDRIGHAAQLTDHGRQLLGYAQQICQISQQMLHFTDTHTEPAGTVRLGMADSLCAPLIAGGFASFHRQYPMVHLKIITAGTKDLFHLLDHNEVDIVCTLDSHVYDTSYIIAAEEQADVHFVASPNHPLSACTSVTLAQLMSYPFMLTEKGMSYRRLLDDHLAKRSLELHPILEMGSADLLCALTFQNAGISFLPDYVTHSAVADGSLVRLNVEDFPAIELWKQVLYRRDKWVSAPMQSVLDYFSVISI